MAKNEREKLTRYVRIVREWSEERPIESVEVTFYNLATLNQDRNKDLWHDLRRALRENKSLRSDDALFYLSVEEMAAKSYWWFDPDEWLPAERRTEAA
jgi:hypothetical protein